MSQPERRVTPGAWLARTGFRDTARAGQQLRDVGLGDHPADDEVVRDLADVGDPDLALTAFTRVLAAATTDGQVLLAAVRQRPGLRHRLFAVLGGSTALGDVLVQHPAMWHVLADDRLAATRPTRLALSRSLLDAVAVANASAAYDALRIAYRERLLNLVARDLSTGLAVEDVAAELSDLADAVLGAALVIARRETGTADDAGLAVIAMGKCGGHELNYVSDVDVLFVAADGEDPSALTPCAAAVMRVCSQVTAEGAIWTVDAALRPEGRSGPLVRSLAGYRGYYERWAATWEFQALLKARAVTGNNEVGAAFIDAITPVVWSAAGRPHFVDDVQQMRRKVVDNIAVQDVDREVKLGRGGLRDVEFAVQLLQLVHGRADDRLRSPTTLVALTALADGGYVGRDDAHRLASAYRFLRTVEHRLQLQALRRTHLLPADAVGRRWLARTMGYRSVETWQAEYDGHIREVRRIHEKLFYRPLLRAVSLLPTEEIRLSPEAAVQRLEALGFTDPTAALRHLEALTSGVSRSAAILRTLLPAMLQWFADAPDPDAGLLSFRRVSDALGATPWYLRVLRDEGVTAQRLASVLATSRYVAELLVRAPETVALLADDRELAPKPVTSLRGEMFAALRRTDDWEDAVAVARALRRRELVRIACGDVLGYCDVVDIGVALSDVTAATLDAALETAARKVTAERRGALPVRLAVIGMGRLGGREQGYASDADIMFVAEPLGDPDHAMQAAHDVALEMSRLLSLPGPDPAVTVDAGLRPEGRSGPLVRTLDSYLEYYRRWGAVWERQALLRARHVAGNVELGERFTAAIEPLRYPVDGLDDAAVREIRRLKARMEAERLPRGVDPALHTKLGRGGLSDVEWAVQLLELQHAHRLPALRQTATLAALAAVRDADLLTAEDAETLREAWLIAARVRNATVLARARASDVLPTDSKSLAAVARAMGYESQHSGDLLEDYRRATRRARLVYEKVLWS